MVKQTEPEEIIIDLVFKGSKNLSSYKNTIKPTDLKKFRAPEEMIKTAVAELEHMGFKIVGGPTPFGVSIAGPPELIKKIFGKDKLKVPKKLKKWIETVSIPKKVKFYQ